MAIETTAVFLSFMSYNLRSSYVTIISARSYGLSPILITYLVDLTAIGYPLGENEYSCG